MKKLALIILGILIIITCILRMLNIVYLEATSPIIIAGIVVGVIAVILGFLDGKKSKLLTEKWARRAK